MERSSKRGKIPQRDWPLIIKRYEDGETLASIARTYDCSPPAISYILSRNRGRDGIVEHSGQNETESSQPVPISGDPGNLAQLEPVQTETETDGAARRNVEARAKAPGDGWRRESHRTDPTQEPNGAPEPSDDPIAVIAVESGGQESHHDISQPTDGADAKAPDTGVPRPAAFMQNGVARRTLHLSSAREAIHRPELQIREARGSDAREHPSEHLPEHEQYGLPRDSGTAQTHKAKDSATFLDHALRERVGEEIAAFLAAFDAALARDSVDTRAGLRDATDRLLRAGARTRIELERLDARVPLSAREDRRSATPGWRPR